MEDDGLVVSDSTWLGVPDPVLDPLDCPPLFRDWFFLLLDLVIIP